MCISIEDNSINQERTRCHNGKWVCTHDITAKNKRKCSKNPDEKLTAQLNISFIGVNFGVEGSHGVGYILGSSGHSFLS